MFYEDELLQLDNPKSITSVPQYMYECAVIDGKLIEGMLKLDNYLVRNECGLIYLSEDDKAEVEKAKSTGFGGAVREILRKFKEAIGHICQGFINAAETFLKKAGVIDQDVLKNAKAAQCDVKDIWYKDYYNACSEIFKANKTEELVADGADYKEDLSAIMKDCADEIGKIPSTVDEFNNKDKFTQDSAAKVVTLGTKSSVMKELGNVLTLSDYMKKIKTLQTQFDRFNEQAVKKTNGTTQANISEEELEKRVAKATAARMNYMNVVTSVCTKTQQIAWRNYREIKAFVKGDEEKKEENNQNNNQQNNNKEQNKNNEQNNKKAVNASYTFAQDPQYVAIEADMFFESIFGF